MGSSIEITPELLAGFLDEAPEYLEMLDSGLMEFESKAGSGVLKLEGDVDSERMNTMFRAAHSLKGLAAAFGFDKIKELTHLMETLFDQVRMGKRDLSSDSFETLFQVFDRLKALVAELSDTSSEPVEIDDILASLHTVLDSQPQVDAPADAQQGTPPPQTTSENPDPQEAPVANEILDDPELTALFVETTSEAIDELNQGLVGLEEDPTNSELLNRVFRSAHNIKGASAAAALTGLNQVTHHMETVFDQLRQGKLALNDELMNVVFSAVDGIRSTIDLIAAGEATDLNPNEYIEKLGKWTDVIDNEEAISEAPPANVSGQPEPTSEMAVKDTGYDESNITIDVKFADGFDEASIQAYLIHNKLSDLGTVISSDPDIDSLAGDTVVTCIVFVVKCDIPPVEIESIVKSFGAETVTVTGTATEDVAKEETTPSAATPKEQSAPSTTSESVNTNAVPSANQTVSDGSQKQQPSAATDTNAKATQKKSSAPASPSSTSKAVVQDKRIPKTGETLRVDQERLDDLMNLGGELVINRARFLEVHSKFREVFDGKSVGYLVEDITDRMGLMERVVDDISASSPDTNHIVELQNHMLRLNDSVRIVRGLVQRVHELRTSMFDFDEALHSLTRVSDAIQKGIMGTRMVSIGPLFTRFRRVVRDICKSSGKQVNLVLRGENTELDKRMIDELGDPLTHMVRNSVDHGIETPDIRIAAGKDPAGTLILQASHRGNSICVEVIDDGAGINIERVKAKALERELATEAQLEKMTEREIAQFIMQPGFSTAEVVTDLSGRGMGMDIVVTKIEKLSGTIELDTKTGEGTRVVIKLPLTLAILTSLVARIGNGVYALPLESVAEIITIRKQDIQQIQRRRVVRVRERIVPVVFFEDVFETSIPGLSTESRNESELTLVIVGIDNEQVGLVVDALLGQEDVVIKSIAENYVNVKGVAGASIRGDGTVSLILDIGTLIDMSAKSSTPPGPEPCELVMAGSKT